MKIFKVTVKAFGPRGYLPLRPADECRIVNAHKARTAIHYVLTALEKAALKGRRPKSYQITVAEMGVIELPKSSGTEVASEG